MTPEESVRRAEKAQRILDDPLYQEAWAWAREKLIRTMLEAEQTDVDKVMGAKAVLAGLEVARSFMDRLMKDGEIAKKELDIASKQRRGLL